MSVVGFDVGYQTSLLGCPRGGGIEVLANEYSLRATPSIVSFARKNRVMGEAGRQNQVMNFKNTIAGFKHLVGRQYDDPFVQKELATRKYKHQAMPDGTVGFVVQSNDEEKVVSATQMLGMMLGKLKSISEGALETKVSDICLGVPCYFSDSQRHAMLESCKIAGLNCLRLFNETTAVALAYGIYKADLPAEGEKPRRVVFVDFGHSQLQMSCCEFVKGKLTVLASKHLAVGGRDLDMFLFNHFCEEFKEKFKLDVKSNSRASIRLEVECEKLKQLMSANSTLIPINIECLMNDKDVTGRMARETFEELAAPVFKQIEDAFAEFIATLGALPDPVQLEDIFSVEIVGGSCRIPAFKRIVAEKFKKDFSTTLNSDEAVARGCALQGAIMSPTFRVRDFTVVDRQYYGICLNWQAVDKEEENAGVIYKPNSKVTSKVISFQRTAPFELVASYEDPSVVPGNESLIATFKVNDVVPAFDESAQKVKIKFKMSEHGTIHIDTATLYEKQPPEPEAPEQPAQTEEAVPMETEADSGEPAQDPAPMDTDTPAKTEEAAKSTEEKKEEEPKKKKVKSKKLPVDEVKPKKRSEQEMMRLVEEELQFATVDRVEVEKSVAKNSLEEYIYEIRDKLYTEEYEPFVREEERAEFSKKLTETEDWLYDEGEDQPKKVYVERLADLKSFGEPVCVRHKESQTRPAALQSLKTVIVHYEKFLSDHAGGDDKYSHIDQTDVDKVKGWVTAKISWLSDKETAQKALTNYDPPAVSTVEIEAASRELEALCNPIVNKTKPPPPKEKKEEKKEDKPEENTTEAPAAETAETPEGGEKPGEEAPVEMDLD